MDNTLLILIGAVAVVIWTSLPCCTFFDATDPHVQRGKKLDRSLVDPDERIDEMRHTR